MNKNIEITIENFTSGLTTYQWEVISPIDCVVTFTNESGVVINSNSANTIVEYDCNDLIVKLEIKDDEVCLATYFINLETNTFSEDLGYNCASSNEFNICTPVLGGGEFATLEECTNCFSPECDDIVFTATYNCSTGLSLSVTGYEGIIESLYTTPSIQGISTYECQYSEQGCLGVNIHTSELPTTLFPLFPNGTYGFNVVLNLENNCTIVTNPVVVNCGDGVNHNISCCQEIDVSEIAQAGTDDVELIWDISDIDVTQNLIVDFTAFSLADRLYVKDFDSQQIIADLGYVGLKCLENHSSSNYSNNYNGTPCTTPCQNSGLGVQVGFTEVTDFTQLQEGGVLPTNWSLKGLGETYIIPKNCNNTTSDIEKVYLHGCGRLNITSNTLINSVGSSRKLILVIESNNTTQCVGSNEGGCTAWVLNTICPECLNSPCDFYITSGNLTCENSNTGVTVNYYISENTSIEVFVNGTSIGVYPNTGSISFNINETYEGETYLIELKALKTGVCETSMEIVIPVCDCTLDIPVLSVTDNECGDNSGSINVVSGCGAGSSIEYSIDGVTWTPYLPNYSATSSLGVIARCVSADCTGETSQLIVTQPTSMPEAPIIDVQNNICPNTTGFFLVTQNCGIGTHIEWSFDGGNTWTTQAIYTTQPETVIARCVSDNDPTCFSNNSNTVNSTPTLCCSANAGNGGDVDICIKIND